MRIQRDDEGQPGFQLSTVIDSMNLKDSLGPARPHKRHDFCGLNACGLNACGLNECRPNESWLNARLQINLRMFQ